MNIPEINDCTHSVGLRVTQTAPGYIVVEMASTGARFLFTVPHDVRTDPEAVAAAIILEVARVLTEESAKLLAPRQSQRSRSKRLGYLGFPD